MCLLHIVLNMSCYRQPILSPPLLAECLKNCDFQCTSPVVQTVSKEAINQLELNGYVTRFLFELMKIKLRPNAEINYMFTHGDAYLQIDCDRYYDNRNDPDQHCNLTLKVKVSTGRVLEITLGSNYH